MKKIINTIIFLSIMFFFNPNALAETKKDCSQYSTKTLTGLNDYMRCKKGLPPLKNNFFKSLKLKSKNSKDSVPKKSCNEYSSKTLTGLAAKINCIRKKNDIKNKVN